MPRKYTPNVLELEADAVILVTSRTPDNSLFKALKARKDEWEEAELEDVYQIGDGRAPQQSINAMFDAHRLAREFDSPHPQYPLPWIRERQIWGSETFPKLGDARPNVEEA